MVSELPAVDVRFSVSERVNVQMLDEFGGLLPQIAKKVFKEILIILKVFYLLSSRGVTGSADLIPVEHRHFRRRVFQTCLSR